MLFAMKSRSRVRGFAGSRVRGFAGSRVRGFAGSRVRGFAGSRGSRVRGFAGSRVHGFTGSRVHGFAGSRVRGFTGSRVHGFAGSRVHGFGFARSRVHGFTGSRVHGFAGSRVRGFTGSRVERGAGTNAPDADMNAAILPDSEGAMTYAVKLAIALTVTAAVGLGARSAPQGGTAAQTAAGWHSGAGRRGRGGRSRRGPRRPGRRARRAELPDAGDPRGRVVHLVAARAGELAQPAAARRTDHDAVGPQPAPRPAGVHPQGLQPALVDGMAARRHDARHRAWRPASGGARLGARSHAGGRRTSGAGRRPAGPDGRRHASALRGEPLRLPLVPQAAAADRRRWEAGGRARRRAGDGRRDNDCTGHVERIGPGGREGHLARPAGGAHRGLADRLRP